MRVAERVFNPLISSTRISRHGVALADSAEISSEVVKRGLIALALLVLVVYGGDYLRLRYRMATNRNPFGSVTLNVYYSVKLKNGKTEFSYGGQQTFECPNTLLPQYWEKPCWFAKRRKDMQINIDSGNPHNPSLY